MNSTLIPFVQDHIEPARDLFLENYACERQHNPLLPSRILDEPEWFPEMLQQLYFSMRYVDNRI